MDLSRFSRNILLNEIDVSGQERICQASILCIGCGGLANHILPILASSGIKTLGIVDFDIVSVSNLPRQVIFREQDIGRKKVDCMKEFLLERNLGCKIHTSYERGEDIVHKIASDYDIIIDLTDSLQSRLNSNKISLAEKKPFFTCSAQGFVGQVYSFANHLANFPCYACLFGDVNESEVLTCQNAGVFPPIVEIIGGFIASNILKYLSDIELDFTEFLLFDLLKNNRKINFLKDSQCNQHKA